MIAIVSMAIIKSIVVLKRMITVVESLILTVVI